MRIVIFIVAFLLAHVAAAQNDKPEAADESIEPKSLRGLAHEADFIGLVQVQAIDYEIVRGLPSKGFAVLNTLIVYRHPGEALQDPRNIQVYARGFSERACYYPERWNEGRRFLVFLEERKQGGFKGTKPWCMLPVFITDQSRYALRYPVPGVQVADESVARELVFLDPDAYVKPGENIPYSRARAFQKQGYLKRTEENRYLFTHGILMSDVRRLMFGKP